MAMIGRGAAIAEVGEHRHELHGVIAFSAWLGVHATLMTGVRNRVDAFITWARTTSRVAPRAAGARPRATPPRIDWDRSDHALSRGRRRRSDRDVVRAHDRRPGADPVRDDVDLPLPVRAAHARAGAAGGDHADALAPHRRRRLAAADAVLRHAAADQLRDRGRDRPGAGVPVRDELVGVLELRRRRVRRAAGDRGPGRVHARGDLPRAVDLRLEPALAARCTSRRSGSRRSAPGCRRTSSSWPTRGCSTRSATRSSTARRS